MEEKKKFDWWGILAKIAIAVIGVLTGQQL